MEKVRGRSTTSSAEDEDDGEVLVVQPEDDETDDAVINEEDDEGDRLSLLQMVENDEDEQLVEVLSSGSSSGTHNQQQHHQVAAHRRAVSSGVPSIDGGASDDGRGALSDSELPEAVRAASLAKQVRGPSSDELETKECRPHELAKAREDKEGWQDALGEGGALKYRILESATDPEIQLQPRDGQWITMDVEEAKGRDNHKQVEVMLGYGLAIEAWELIAKLMRVGEKAELRTDARLAYGDEEGDMEKGIEPGERLTYSIKITALRDGDSMENASKDYVVDLLEKLRDAARWRFSRADWERALFIYRRGVSLEAEALGRNWEKQEEVELRTAFAALHANAAACFLKMEEYREAVQEARRATEMDPSAAKAHFRLGVALTNLGSFPEAKEALRAAERLEPTNLAVRRQLAECEKRRTDAKAHERRVARRMLAGAGGSDDSGNGAEGGSLLENREGHYGRWARLALIGAFFVAMLALFVHFLLQTMSGGGGGGGGGGESEKVEL